MTVNFTLSAEKQAEFCSELMPQFVVVMSMSPTLERSPRTVRSTLDGVNAEKLAAVPPSPPPSPPPSVPVPPSGEPPDEEPFDDELHPTPASATAARTRVSEVTCRRRCDIRFPPCWTGT